MFRSVLVPTDGSAGDDAATAHAIELATAYEATVHSLSVVQTLGESASTDDAGLDDLYDSAEQRGREATVRIADSAEGEGVGAAREVREGVPHEAIVAYADEHDVELIVMATHGRTGVEHARLGSTTERVVTMADVPVLTVAVPEADAEPGPVDGYDRIVIPTDGSDAAERAAERALDVAETYDADVHVVYVVDATIHDLEDAPRSIVGLLEEGGREATQAIAQLARDGGVDVGTDVRRGRPSETLLEYVTSVDADLVAMGTRGRAVGTGPLLGSTTARVVRRSPVPVLTVG